MEAKKLNCGNCGKEFYRTGYAQKYCNDCGKEYKIARYLAYRATNRGKETFKANKIKHAYKHKDRRNAYYRTRDAERALWLTFQYCKYLWNRKFRHHNCVPPEFTNEIWLREKIRIQALRRIKQLKLNLNENI